MIKITLDHEDDGARRVFTARIQTEDEGEWSHISKAAIVAIEALRKLRQQAIEDQSAKVFALMIRNFNDDITAEIDAMSNAKKKEIDQLRRENVALREIIRKIHWMARRYADGRASYATHDYNEQVRKMLALKIDVFHDPLADGCIWARDQFGRKYDGLTDGEAEGFDPHSTDIRSQL